VRGREERKDGRYMKIIKTYGFLRSNCKIYIMLNASSSALRRHFWERSNSNSFFWYVCCPNFSFYCYIRNLRQKFSYWLWCKKCMQMYIYGLWLFPTYKCVHISLLRRDI
jgi:hypothetical protein